MCTGMERKEAAKTYKTAECKKLAQMELTKDGGTMSETSSSKSLPEDSPHPEGVNENDQVKVLRDFTVQTDHHLEDNRPDIVDL